MAIHRRGFISMAGASAVGFFLPRGAAEACCHRRRRVVQQEPAYYLILFDEVTSDRFSSDRQTEVRVYSKVYRLPNGSVFSSVKTLAMIHLSGDTAIRIKNGANDAAAAIAAALSATGVGASAAVWVPLGIALTNIGYDNLKNADGSLDLRVREDAAYYWHQPTNTDILFLQDPVPPGPCAAVLNSL